MNDKRKTHTVNLGVYNENGWGTKYHNQLNLVFYLLVIEIGP